MAAACDEHDLYPAFITSQSQHVLLGLSRLQPEGSLISDDELGYIRPLLMVGVYLNRAQMMNCLS